ncbi:uncharacterized protein LOC107484265 [Arachis duranensis]|uniref:Uncharacterized protein LOC107484265 n=1 Tax=Arachis duranensis TaxID=130453 RepID=A0A9C6WI16_ARADU|nr:uncharacterized protein LOC107484265 [Arachis duranensis]
MDFEPSEEYIGLSVPVAFQNPAPVTLFGLALFLYESSFYEAKKTILKLGMNYEKIHACPNNCMLYWGEDKEKEMCKVCNRSRWKLDTKGGEIQESNDGNIRKKVPAKVLRYFPLKPRLQRLFLSSKTAEAMRWHDVAPKEDGVMTHPRDSEAWKMFDLKNTSFAEDPRNIRLALATDGINPYRSMNANSSTWPVILIPYNTPPWICMKRTSFILSMIIPGKKMPGNNIDVYLQPLIKELKELWNEGVDAYDSFEKKAFKLHAALMWTISDFPGLGILSGWNTYTGLACPSCNFDSVPFQLPHSRKSCFIGHRRFLNQRHRFRLNRVRFNGEQEFCNPPKRLSGLDILEQVKDINVTFGRKEEAKVRGKRRRGERAAEGAKQWRKKSIFFELPYWKYNLLCHNLDVMHIEKNVCDNVIYTLLNDSTKSKDHLNARKDLKALGCKQDLWPDENGKYAPAIFTLTNKGKKAFLSTLKNISVPDGYSSNISRCIDVDNLKINGMLKSHDNHILMQQLLPLAMRTSLPSEVSAILIELCSFFRKLCEKRLIIKDLDKLQDQIVLTLCHMEMLFPPSFFIVMIHLVVHLVEEVKLGGPVHYRWMYPIEKYLGQLKSYVRNKAQPEGSIAEGYLMQEILTFCSRYLDNIETIWNRRKRVGNEPTQIDPNSRISKLFPQVGESNTGFTYFTLSPIEKRQAHRHVFTNCRSVDNYLRDYRDIVKKRLRSRTRDTTEIDKKVHREFVDWFSNHICTNLNKLPDVDKDILISLSQGPYDQARKFSSYDVNGYRFQTLARDNGLKTQNSGVFGTFGTRSYSSSKDTRMNFGAVPYYGKLVDIIELFYNGFTVLLFKCQWANTTSPRGIKKDNLGFLSVNFTRLIHTGEHEDDEPYIKASEAQMVYYVDDEKEKGWCIPIHLKPRDLYNMSGDNMGEDDEITVSNDNYPPQDLESLFPYENTNIKLARIVVDDDLPIINENYDENEDMLV